MSINISNKFIALLYIIYMTIKLFLKGELWK